LEPALVQRGGHADRRQLRLRQLEPESFRDGQFIRATGSVRLLDLRLALLALGGLPAVLKKMSKLEMDALRNSDEGRRMSKSALSSAARKTNCDPEGRGV
jgi:hypothetical protein